MACPTSMDGVRLAGAILLAVMATGCSGRRPADAEILLYAGRGTSDGDVTAIEAVLEGKHLPYATATSWQLNRMSAAELRAYRLLIVPGGNFIKIGNGLTAGTTANLRSAVQSGTNYLGICAGAFFAGHSPYNGLNLTGGVRFGFYSAEDRGIHKAAVPVSVPDGPALEQYWEDGPQLNGWGEVAARYPDGTAAIVQGTYGSGWVLLSGVHPEAPETWRRGVTFGTPAGDDNAFAARLIETARNGTRLPHY